MPCGPTTPRIARVGRPATRGGCGCPNNSGYTSFIEHAGIYSEREVTDRAGYYNNGESTIAIRCQDVQREMLCVVPDHALTRLTKKRFERLMTESEPCPHCGSETPTPVCVGVKVVGDA